MARATLVILRAVVPALALLAGPALAQNFAAPGQNWSASWGFGSMAQRSLQLQQAQAIRSATTPAGPSTVIYNTNSYDNRSNYQEILGGAGGLGAITFQNADVIGQNTNSVGAMNTGTTTIDLVGDNNVITATNAADSRGCIDGSVQNLSSTLTDLASASGMIAPSVSFTGANSPCRP